MESYGRLCTRFYDVDKPQAPKQSLDFYLGYCERAHGAILEPMSGSGRFLMPILERGFDIDGVDASLDMLEACQQRCRDKGLLPRLFKQDIERMTLPRQYSLVIMPASSFCLLTEADQIKATLDRIASAMLSGAMFVLEIELHRERASHSWPWTGRWVDLPGGGRIVLSSLATYNSVEHIMRSVNRYELVQDGKVCETEMEEFNLRYYDQAEFSALLECAGFHRIKCLRPYVNENVEDADESVVYECQKP